MVRLQRINFAVDPQKGFESQFHYGSITTKETIDSNKFEVEVSIPLWFDYNEEMKKRILKEKQVSIPLWFDYNEPHVGVKVLNRENSLNSTMVRLQQPKGNWTPVVNLMSQFHYGSITTRISLISTLILNFVSIPLWFDYNQKRW